MIDKAFKMQVISEFYADYKRRHDELWPEMRDTLKSHGVLQYRIFLDEETGALFAHAKIKSEEQWEAISSTDVCRRWWDYMADIMIVNDDNSPKSVELKNVFEL